MNIYMAPMEGITGYIYRKTYDRYFKGVDKYFTPFIVPGRGRPLRKRELRDVLPENNQGMNVVPQVLLNDVNSFVDVARMLKDFGYNEVNINMGCPSGTVVSKRKGAGILSDIDKLDEFLYGVFEADVVEVSVKTRIGIEDYAEWAEIMEVYKKYPMKELIIHPRLRKDFYKNDVNMDAFLEAKNINVNEKLCYNGDINTYADYDVLTDGIDSIMLGRGLIGNPFLPDIIRTCEKEISEEKKSFDLKSNPNGSFVFDSEKRRIFRDFHNELHSLYIESEVGAGNSMFKMKELWLYMERLFDEEEKRAVRKIIKSKNVSEYKVNVGSLLK